jgi:guanylate kinase
MTAADESLMDQAHQGDGFIADLRARRRPRLYVISGPSGVGKDAVIERLRDIFPEMHFAVTATTRPRRPGEIDGIHYYFTQAEDFSERLGKDEFLESALVYGNHYGVPKTPIRHALRRGQDVVVKVDVQGAAAIQELAPDACFIFLAPESLTELLRRLRSRKTDEPEALMNRFNAASRELLEAKKFDYIIFNENDKIEETLDQLKSIVAAERLRSEQADISI